MAHGPHSSFAASHSVDEPSYSIEDEEKWLGGDPELQHYFLSKREHSSIHNGAQRTTWELIRQSLWHIFISTVMILGLVVVMGGTLILLAWHIGVEGERGLPEDASRQQ